MSTTHQHPTIAIPDFLMHLETYHGLPVPFIQAVFNGVPDFRAIDPDKVVRCVNEKLCAVCGRRLGEYCFFIGGPLSKENHFFSDPAMHEKCANFAAQTCPFVSGNKQTYSDRELDHTKIGVNKLVRAAARPSEMFIFKCRTKTIQQVSISGSLTIQAGRWLGERTIK